MLSGGATGNPMGLSLLQTGLFAFNRPEPIRQASLLMVLASGIGNGDALINGLRSHAAECGSPWSDRVNALRILLEQGLPLSTALRNNVGLLPETVISAIRIGEQTGTLREVLADEAQRLVNESSNVQLLGLSAGNSLLWLAVVGTIMTSVVTFLMVFIIPKFKRIFEDFGTELPAITVRLLDISDFTIAFGGVLFLPVLGCVASIVFLRVYTSYQRITRGSPPLAEHWPRFWVPEVLRMLSITAAAGQPLPQTLHSIISDLRPGKAATALSGARYRMDTGQDAAEAMLSEKLISKREAAFLQASVRNGHLDWGLRHLGHAIEIKRLRWIKRLAMLIEPAVILIAGIFVGFVVIAMFLPLIKLLNDLS